jgi:hypothetical protein
VRRRLAAWLFLTGVAAVALGLARLLAPGWFELELDVFVLAVGAIALANIVIATREAYPPEESSAIAEALAREPPNPSRPAELDRLERELTMASATAFDLHARLRPLVHEIAAMRLAANGVRLQDGEDELGEDLWELVRPDRPAPTDRHASGLPPAALRRVVERLETL